MKAIEDIINIDSSRIIADIAVKAVGKNKTIFKKVIDLTFKDEPTRSMRAARVADYSCEKYPDLALPHLNYIIRNTGRCKTDGVKRSMMRLLIRYTKAIKKSKKSRLMDLCFTLLQKVDETVAVKVNCIYILETMVNEEPDIIPEFISVLQDPRQRTTPAYHLVANKVVNNLRKKHAKHMGLYA